MIDWLSFSIPYDGPGVGVQFLKRKLHPGPEGQRPALESAYTLPFRLEGSWSSTIAVHAIGGRLHINGNPVKWLTGQNVVGSNNIQRLVEITINAVLHRLNLPDCERMRFALARGNVDLHRVDCTFSYSVGSDDEVASWLEAMGRSTHIKQRGRGHYDPGMCALRFGMSLKEGAALKGSRRSTFKFYNKRREMLARPQKCAPELAAELLEKVTGLVRGEATYRGLELKRIKRAKLREWTEATAWELHRAWVEKMEISEGYMSKETEERKLPRKLQGTYLLWKQGEDLRGMLNKATFWRHRRELLALGIDIALPVPRLSDEERAGRVVPVLKVLEARPMPEDQDEALFWRLAA